MSTAVGTGAMPASGRSLGRGLSLRVRGIALLIGILAESVVGAELAMVVGPYPDWLLAAHIVISLLLVIFSGVALAIAWPLPSSALRISAVITFISVIGATIAGSDFLWGGQSNAALMGMEGFAGLAFLGALLLIVFGGKPATLGPADALPSA
jgi:hypothetical protein